MGDLRNAVGQSLIRAVPRLFRGLRTLRSGIRGDPVASRGLPIRVQLEITDRCNFDCTMCNRNSVIADRAKRKNDLDVDQVLQIIDQIKPAYVTLNGNGEPLLYRGLKRLLAACRRQGLITAMPSNMSLMSGARLDALLESPPTFLTCSLYGTNDATFRAVTRSRLFERCLDNLEQLVARMPAPEKNLRVLIALHATNARDYEATFELLSRLGLLAVTGIVPTHDYDNPNADGVMMPSPAEFESTLDDLDRSITACEDPAKRSFLEQWRRTLSSLRSREQVHETRPCLVPWISTYIDAVGDVRPCCYLSDSEHVMGNVTDTRFEDIWNGDAYQDFRRRMTRGREGLDTCRRCARNDAPRIERYRFLAGGRCDWLLSPAAGHHAEPARTGAAPSGEAEAERP